MLGGGGDDFQRGVEEGLAEEVTVPQRPEGGVEASHAGISGV